MISDQSVYLSADGSEMRWSLESSCWLHNNLLRECRRFGWNGKYDDVLTPPNWVEINEGWETNSPIGETHGRWIFPFSPSVTPVTVMPTAWDENGIKLPALIHAPDAGTMLLTIRGAKYIIVNLEGDRQNKVVDLIVDIECQNNQIVTLRLEPFELPRPGEVDEAIWPDIRSGWLSGIQNTAHWGDQGRPFSSPPGLLANNVISDPASCSIWFYADQAWLTPVIGHNINPMDSVRRTLDFWMDHRMHETGEVICYWDKTDFLDANAGPLIAAWDYVDSTHDDHWLSVRISQLELIANFLAQRDINNDGIVEAKQPGTPGTLVESKRSCAWWDALNCGHQDAYSNALIYRAWCCMAELEERLNRSTQAQHYQLLAKRLKATYRSTFYNNETGMLMWWRDRDGGIHDFYSPIINGLAIECGLIDKVEGKQILDRLHLIIEKVGFNRFDLGIPSQLICVPRNDYLIDGWGEAKEEDGSDTFQHYMNAGITAGHILHWLMAHYVVDDKNMSTKADAMFHAMLSRQRTSGFHNGVTDEAEKGIDWTDWQGNPCGYEGYLADSFRFLQTAFLRNEKISKAFYRPIHRIMMD